MAASQPGYGLPAELLVRDSLVVKNRYAGINLISAKGTVERTAVRDTRAEASAKQYGTGIWAMVLDSQSKPSELTVRESLVARNQAVGIAVANSRATVEETVVRDTRVQLSDHRYGTGIEVSGQVGQLAELTVRGSLVTRNQSEGLALFGAIGRVESCAVSVVQNDRHGEFGDGILITDKSTIHVQDSLVEHTVRAGILYSDSGGSVRRSLIRHNVLAIDLEKGASPAIGTDNYMVENRVNHVTFGQKLKIPPIPPIPVPFGVDAAGPDAGASAQ